MLTGITGLLMCASTTALPSTAGNFRNAADALDQIYTEYPDANLLFGYTHRLNPYLPSAVNAFTNNVLSSLPDYDINDLILEIFPVGEPGSNIEVEIKHFNVSGIIGTEMRRFLPFMDSENFTLLLYKAYSLGITIHSGGVDYAQVDQTIFGSSYQSGNSNVIIKIKKQIAENSLRRAIELYNERKRFASLGGMIHNDQQPQNKDQFASFAPSLDSSMVPTVEIDLVVPELSKVGNLHNKLPLSKSRRSQWESYIPQRGINLVQGNTEKTFILFWPIKRSDYH